MITRVNVHGWDENGPTYDIERRRSGFKHRRNRYSVETRGDNQGGTHPDPAHHVVRADGKEIGVLFNKGFVYEVFVIIDDDHEVSVHVDAEHHYKSMALKPGVKFIDYRLADPVSLDENAGTADSESSDDDEDAPFEERETSDDEEE